QNRRYFRPCGRSMLVSGSIQTVRWTIQRPRMTLLLMMQVAFGIYCILHYTLCRKQHMSDAILHGLGGHTMTHVCWTWDSSRRCHDPINAIDACCFPGPRQPHECRGAQSLHGGVAGGWRERATPARDPDGVG